MVPIEKCPVYLRAERENYWISHYDLIDNGLNACYVDDEEHGAQPVKCRHCGISIRKSGIARHEKSCEKNPSMMKFACQWCGHCVNNDYNLKKHEGKCAHNPKNAKAVDYGSYPLSGVSIDTQNPRWNVNNHDNRKSFNHKKHGGVEQSLKAALEFRVDHLKQTGNNLTTTKHSNGFDPASQVDVNSTPVDEVVDILLQRYRGATTNP